MAKPPDVDRLNELVSKHGLATTVAFEVLNGKQSLEQALERKHDREGAAEWSKGFDRETHRLVPLWDRDPKHFHLTADGLSVSAFADAYPDIKLCEAAVADIVGALCEGSTRIEDPWSDLYRSKTSVIAYRWLTDRPVSPPMLAPHAAGLVLVGGNHRFWLARDCGARDIPILIESGNEAEMRGKLPKLRVLG